MGEIKKKAVSVDTKAKIAQVASVSSADSTIGNLIADAMEKVGNDGVITVEDSKLWVQALKLWKVCSLTVGISARTWFPMLIKWNVS